MLQCENFSLLDGAQPELLKSIHAPLNVYIAPVYVACTNITA